MVTPDQIAEIEAYFADSWVLDLEDTFPKIRDANEEVIAIFADSRCCPGSARLAEGVVNRLRAMPELCAALREALERVKALEAALSDWGATCVSEERFPSQATMEITVECTGKLAKLEGCNDRT